MAITFIMLRSTSKLVNIHLPLDIASSLPKAVLFFVRVMFITVNTFQLFYIHNITCYNCVSMTLVLCHKYLWHMPIFFLSIDILPQMASVWTCFVWLFLYSLVHSAQANNCHHHLVQLLVSNIVMEQNGFFDYNKYSVKQCVNYVGQGRRAGCR